MSLQQTPFVIQAANLPERFTGNLQQFYSAMVARMRIMSPAGIVGIVVGDTEPNSNQGIWLKNGSKLYSWDETTKRYAPIDISDSWTQLYTVSDTVPASSTPPVWLRTVGGRYMGWYFWDGTAWAPDMNIVQSGSTANRPASPQNLQQYYDSDIGCLIWWERGAWRTVSGSPGDIKHVLSEVLTEALRLNPGWDVVGASQQAWRGRWISQATKDPGVAPETALTVNAGIAQRAAHEIYGETDAVAVNPDPPSPVPYPPTIALWTLVKL